MRRYPNTPVVLVRVVVADVRDLVPREPLACGTRQRGVGGILRSAEVENMAAARTLRKICESFALILQGQ